jgi:hypothetical protein
MVLGEKPVPPAPPAAPATAEKLPAAPPSDASAEADPRAPESVTAVPRSEETDSLVNVLQQPVQPWRLISARRNTEIGVRLVQTVLHAQQEPRLAPAGDLHLLLRGTWLTLPAATRARKHGRNRSRSKSSGASVLGPPNQPPLPPSRKHAVNGLSADV